MFNSKLISTKTFIALPIVLIMFLSTSCKTDETKLNEETLEAKVENAAEKSAEKIKETAASLNSKAESLVNKAEKEMNLSRGKDVFNLTQVDTPPLFDPACKTSKNPGKCSEEKIMQFIKQNAKFPNKTNANIKSLEQVIVVIDKDGNLSDTKFIASGNSEACKACQQAAADVIGMMKKWTPAMKDGKAVASQMTIPVKFGK